MSADSPPAPATGARTGALGRLLRAPWFGIAAGMVAAALLITAGILFVGRFEPFASAARSEYAPSAFPTSLSATTSPLVSRGGTVSLSVQSLAPDSIERVELWDGDQLYYELTQPPSTATGEGQLASIAVDFVPTTAGTHILAVRTVATSGQVSLSDPVVLPVLDLPDDIGLAPAGLAPGESSTRIDPASGVTITTSAPFPSFVSMRSSLGDTLAVIAGRLSVEPSALLVNGIAGLAATTLLEPGSVIRAPLIDRDTARQLGYGLTDISPWLVGLAGTVTDCTVTISLSGITETMALFATSPVQPGYIRIGNVSPGEPWTSATMPIGPTMYVAYRTGASSSDTAGSNAPTAPLYLAVPSSCAEQGWSGDASIVNGALSTSSAIDSPYAYISVDAGQWVRVPSAQGTYLPSGSLNDIRSSLTLAQYDQVDIEVWSFDGSDSTKAATGQFCRKNVANAAPAGGTRSSGSGGQCRPAGTSPGGDTSLARTGSLEIAFADPASAGSSTISLTEDRSIDLAVIADNTDATRVIYQFSYFPLATTTTAIRPPGVLTAIDVPLSRVAGEPSESLRRSATVSFSPWKWRDARVTPGDSTTFDAGGNNLELDDELALAIANAKLAAGSNLIDTLYVRAIAVRDEHYAAATPIGLATQSLVIDMHDYASYGTIANPSIRLESGLDSTAPDTALRHKCFEVIQYPEPDTFELYPYNAPLYDERGDLQQAQSGFSDLDVALFDFPSVNVLQCLAPDSDEVNARAAAAAAAKANDCDFACFIFAVALGAVVGFATGGPTGALFGAAAGFALAYENPELAAAIFAAAKAYWDLVAMAYNAAMSSIFSTISEFNPVCAILAASGKDSAHDKCVAVTGVAVQAAITSVTHLPPSLPMSDALVELAKGELQQLVVIGIDQLLGAAGVSCATFTISDPDAVWAVQSLANKAKNTNANTLIEASKKDGKLNGCEALANLVIAGVKDQYTQSYGSYITSAMERPIVPNLIVEAVSDTPPRITVTGAAAEGVTRDDTCPVTANVYITKRYHFPGSSASSDADYEFQLQPLNGTLTAGGSPTAPLSWSGTITIPILPYQKGVADQLLLKPATKSTAASPAFLHYFVSSPCLAAVYEYSATEFPAGSGTSTFVVDSRPFQYYQGVW